MYPGVLIKYLRLIIEAFFNIEKYDYFFKWHVVGEFDVSPNFYWKLHCTIYCKNGFIKYTQNKTIKKID